MFSRRLCSLCARSCRRVSLVKTIHSGQLALCYKSQYSLDKLYPRCDESAVDNTVKVGVGLKDEEKEPFSGIIPTDQLDIKYIRGSGPGGQNVNKVNTKVEVRFHVESASWIPKWIRERVLEMEPGRINKEGYLILTSEKTRKQFLNQADCMDKLRVILFAASTLPKQLTDEEIALRDKRMAAAKKAVLRIKRNHSLKKESRQSPSFG
ncbi:peptidyl-tRNA hydrolase ICT1, mitochondrial-like [Gigantopelta aegis]|uniref:peptidyl-tRNA hydrolase ICT1, mitochondrial-like n=1 Tax=Gigantopelta aegis TaxID=1735272 RepID=UPI001B889AB4|nr:peptidyl-tRNA hydrolase ICT1, mitochondrial-like [Gigantopelta aegis]